MNGLRWPANEKRLLGAIEDVPAAGTLAWRSLFQGMGYQVEQLPQRGYLLRHDNAPVAVVHPHRDASQFSRLTENGELPEGMVLADCGQQGAAWGVLTAGGRYRLFQRRPPIGSAAGQHIEIDTAELERKDRLYLGLLAPQSLKENGWLTDWVGEAKDFGEELRKGLEERLIKGCVAQHCSRTWRASRIAGRRSERPRATAANRHGALTLVFRFMFRLHTEARGYLPVGSAAYRPHSARQLAEDSRLALSGLSRRSTQRWDRLRTLVRMVRTGDRSTGVPAYNGSLFAADGFPGSALLEQAEVADIYLAPALAAIAYDTDRPGAPGLDYAGLLIGHLGATYGALLTLKLTRAPGDLAYDLTADELRFIFTDFTENAVSPAYRRLVMEKFEAEAAKWLADAGGSAPDMAYIPRRGASLPDDSGGYVCLDRSLAPGGTGTQSRMSTRKRNNCGSSRSTNFAIKGLLIRANGSIV